MRLNLHRSGPWIGIGGVFILLFIAFPAFFLRFAPWWGVVLILGLLVIQAIIISLLAKRRPEWCAYVPLFGLVAYFALIFVGINWWGWHIPS